MQGLFPFGTLQTMRARTWTGAVPRLYDACMAPLEWALVRGWRQRLWRGVRRDGTGLEIGAGSGANLRMHEPRDGLILSDIAPSMLRRLRLHGERRGARKQSPLMACDVTALPLPDASLDYAVATLVFCEVAEPMAGLLELRRVLRPGGSLHLMEHVRPGGAAGVLAEAVTRVTGPLFGEHFDRATQDLVEPAGFTLTSREWLLADAVVLLRAVAATQAASPAARRDGG